ncbi:tape measure protein [Acinetobacter bereziniae]|uniref:tape measure protein n=1 Tax=Acinetobacter bereziniae TaxID=106648 RepID=UPI00125069DE|nr:tape measure protein [Acinetobacter bereziniae]
MAGQNLTFKLILDGDNKSLVSAVKQSESSVNSVLESIKQEAERLKKTSEETNKATAKIISDEVSTDAKKASDGLKDVAEAEQKVSNESSELEQKIQQIIDELNKAQNASKSTENGFNSLSNEARNTANESAQVAKELNETNTSSAKLSTGLNGLKTGLTLVASAFAAVGVGLGIRELAQAADSYTNLSARIKIATQDGGNFTQAMSGVHQVALATNSNLTSTADLFTRLNAVGKDMGVTQQQALDLTKTVTQAIKIGGGSAEAADGAVTQFIQAMQGGVLRGEEFNSIMEGGYGLAEALARGLGVTTGELRKMAEAGELSSERVVKALQTQSASVQATYDKFPTTISNALQRISTSWEILIGKMDQASGTSSQVAKWLVMLADNIQELQIFLGDIGDGFVWIGDKLQSIDSSTIRTLKSTLSEVYEIVKKNIADVATLGETIWSAFTTALDAVSPLFAALLSGKSEVSGLEVALNTLRMAFASISDISTGFNIGLKLLLSGIQFLSGGLYALSSQILGFLGFDTLAEQAMNASDRMFAQAEKNGNEAVKLAENHKWAVVETYKDIGKTEEQRNKETIVNNQKTLDGLKAQEAKHSADYKAISDQRLVLEQQLYEAKKTGNQASVDLALKGLADLEAKEKAYQAESTKLTQAKIEAAQAVAEATIKSGDAAGQAALKVLNVKLALQGLKAEFDETGKIIVSAMSAGTEAVEVQDDTITKARKGAVALGLDLDVALNRVSEKFASNKVHLDNFANGLTTMGAKGTQATDALYQGWEKWAEKAKNQAEIEAAKQQLLSFEKQGVFSTKQVQMGMEYLDQINGKIPENISEIEKAYKLLGVTSKEEAAKIADSQMRAFNVMKQSGTASAEQVRQALINMADKIYASGNAAKIAWYEGQLAANGLASSVNEVGKVTVDAGSQMETSMQRVSSATYGAQQSFRDLGEVAREEALSSSEAWAKALDSQQGGMHVTPRGERTRLAFNQSEVEAQLKAMGYDDKNATKIAKNILESSKSADGRSYKNASMGWLSKNGFDIVGAFAGGGGGMSNANYVREQLERYSQYSNNTSATLDTGASKTVKYEISTGKNKVDVYGSPSAESNLNSILSELETINKGS